MTPEQTTHDGGAADAKTIALRFYEPLRSGDAAGAAEFLAEDWQDIPLNAGQSPGRAGFTEMADKLHGFMPDLTWQIDDVVAEGNRVVVRSTLSGTPQGKLLGLHLRGDQVSFMAIDIHEVADGKIKTTWHVEDKAAILGQLRLPHVTLR